MTTRNPVIASAARPSKRIHLQIAGMSCASCVDHVRSAIGRVRGARVIAVGLGGASIELEAGVESRAVVRAIAAAGYEVFGVRPLDVSEDSTFTPTAASAGGCCCSSKAAHQPVLLKPTR